jgi:hypothetical protein
LVTITDGTAVGDAVCADVGAIDRRLEPIELALTLADREGMAGDGLIASTERAQAADPVADSVATANSPMKVILTGMSGFLSAFALSALLLTAFASSGASRR